MLCPHCNRETDTEYFKDGAGICTQCNRLVEYDATKEWEEEGLIQKPLTLIPAKEITKIKMPKKQLVDGFIQPETVTSFIGGSDKFKSTILLALAAAISTGKPFIGRKCKKSKVLYMDKENPNFLIGDRLKKIHKGLGVRQNKNMYFLLGQGSFDDKKFLDSLTDTLIENKIKVVCIDSMIRYHSGEENSARDINLIYRAFVRITEEAKAAILFLHHAGKNNQSRGSSDIKAMVDFSYKIERKDNETPFIKVINEKNRTGKIPDINLEVLYTDTSILINENDKEELNENAKKSDEFVMLRGFILQFARSELVAGNNEFKRANLIVEINLWNADNKNFGQLKKSQIKYVLNHLNKIGALKKCEKKGYYTLGDYDSDQITKWIDNFNYLKKDFGKKQEEAKKQESGLNAFN